MCNKANEKCDTEQACNTEQTIQQDRMVVTAMEISILNTTTIIWTILLVKLSGHTALVLSHRTVDAMRCS